METVFGYSFHCRVNLEHIVANLVCIEIDIGPDYEMTVCSIHVCSINVVFQAGKSLVCVFYNMRQENEVKALSTNLDGLWNVILESN